MRWREARKRPKTKAFTSLLNAYTIAPFSKRFKAFVVDSFMLLMPILYIVFYLVFGSREIFEAHMLEGWLLILLPYFVITTLFFALKGQTPGFKAYEITLMDLRTHQKASFVTLSIRFMLLLLASMSVVALFIPLWRKDRLGIHDLLSHSAPVLSK